MYEELIKSVLEKEKTVYHTVNGGLYLVKGVGNLYRVTSVLGAINFDNGSLDKWKKKMAIESIKKDIPLTGSISVKDACAAFAKALDAGDTFAKSAANFGTTVHGWLETFAITGGFPKDIDPYSPMYKVFQSVQKFVKDFGIGTDKVTVIKPELFVYHTLGYAGTADLVCIRNGNVYLIDYKATNSLKTKYLLQLAAYTAALKELYGLDVYKAILIRFDKNTGDYERVPVTKEELVIYFEMFKACLMFYRFIQNPTYASVKDLNTMERLAYVTGGILK